MSGHRFDDYVSSSTRSATEIRSGTEHPARGVLRDVATGYLEGIESECGIASAEYVGRTPPAARHPHRGDVTTGGGWRRGRCSRCFLPSLELTAK